jgi:hypothetical protein
MAAASAADLASLAPAMAQAQTAPTGVYATIGYGNASLDPLNLGAVQGRSDTGSTTGSASKARRRSA